MSGVALSTKSIVLLLAAVIVIAFLGVIAGNWFVGWRQAQVEAENLGDVPSISTLFNKNDQFPDIELIDINGKSVMTSEVFSDVNSVILFISPGCQPCSDAIALWNKFQNDIEDNFQVIGICESSEITGREYLQKTGFPFAAYFDTSFVLNLKYDITQFPNVMGLYAGGEIAFENRGLYGGFSPVDACDLIAASAARR